MMMPITGLLIPKIGCKKIILTGGLGIGILLPLLLLPQTIWQLGLLLFLFGASIGMIDVSMNTHGAEVQKLYGKSIMSSLHGLYSTGGIVGAIGIGLLMHVGLTMSYAVIIISASIVFLLFLKYPYLLDTRKETIEETRLSQHNDKIVKSSWLHPQILLLGLMCFTVFISEGAMLDWSAIFLKESKKVSPEFSGIGFGVFSCTMALMRFFGDALIERFDSMKIVVIGCIIAALGLIISVYIEALYGVLLGFILLGIGVANVIPIFFSEASKTKGISTTAGLAAVTTMGYAGQLVGPASLGYVSHVFSIDYALLTVAMLLLLVAIVYAIKNSFFTNK